MKFFKCGLVISVFVLFAQSIAASEAQGDGGNTLPWPWGTECPFPWNSIEGVWTEAEPRSKELPKYYFEFEIIDEWSTGAHVFEVRQYNRRGEMIAEGTAIARTGHRIVRVMLLSEDGNKSSSFVVIARAYHEDRFSCSEKLMTVFTMRERGAPIDNDVHLIVKKCRWPIEETP